MVPIVNGEIHMPIAMLEWEVGGRNHLGTVLPT